ncbi:hypothetical protein ACIQXA_24900 [Streptomyces massasporeus]|uniref:hypothetical protein n=1 Tax=Streptomyces massasporeus TaxID=67324 RepID=UPI0038018D7D
MRRWRADKLASGTGPTTVAKAYALLCAIMGTAVADQMIRRNPCTIKGAGTVQTPERPTATVQEVYDLADAMQPRYRALVLMAGFLGLRRGELIGLHRRDIDLDHGTVRVRRAVAELFNGQREIKAPKSAAGKRTVSIPAAITPDIRDHLERYAELAPTAGCSSAPRGRPLAETTSTGCGARRATRPGSRACTSTIFGTRATPWRPPLARAHVS